MQLPHNSEDLWLVLPNGKPLSSQTEPPKGIEDILWHMNFFNGNVDYLLSHIELTQKKLEENPKLSRQFLQLKVEKDPLKKEIFYSNSILCDPETIS